MEWFQATRSQRKFVENKRNKPNRERKKTTSHLTKSTISRMKRMRGQWRMKMKSHLIFLLALVARTRRNASK
jgi:hypothetical protein